ncbi:MAG: Gfo/Idh/MocA family oxidoreductase [Phycisphaeraceae bacterium]|nr:Gfo/Idh/MocA family oxidoreductase [Phycisphaeraceae bacterium]
MKRIKIGITGIGGFAQAFIPLFKAHPHVESVSIAELLPDRRKAAAEKFGLQRAFATHEELCASDVDAVAIITQRHLHGPQAIHALNHGKHVYCAVPAAGTLDEIGELVRTVERTGLLYMMGETSYYYPAAVFCREKQAQGAFGRFVYGEGEYLHDMSHGFYQAYQHSGGKDWKKVAGIPPMHYPTHSTSFIVSLTGAKLTSVSCLGYVDHTGDGVFGKGNNLWDNPFSNQTALFRVSNGGMCRVNEFRRVGCTVGNSVRTSIFGTEGCYEQQMERDSWTTLGEGVLHDVTDLLTCRMERSASEIDAAGGQQMDFFTSTAKIHPVHRLPRQFIGHGNGHFGSHQFLVDDFVRSVVQQRLAPNHVWAAASYTAPGLVAHQSAMREGEQLAIPDFGNPPAGSELIRYDAY